MKIKVRFNKRYNLVVTILACMFSVWMMVKNYDLPQESVIKFGVICLVLILAIVIVAAPIAFICRWLSDRRDQ